jgi:hypothetical protein
MDTTQVGMILWIAAGLLMLIGLVGTVLALLLEKATPLPAIAPEPVPKVLPRAAELVEEAVEPERLAARLRKRSAAYRLGMMVLGGLALLTAVEFWIGAGGGSVVFLFLIALVKAGLILQYFMHMAQLWGEGETHG